MPALQREDYKIVVTTRRPRHRQIGSPDDSGSHPSSRKHPRHRQHEKNDLSKRATQHRGHQYTKGHKRNPLRWYQGDTSPRQATRRKRPRNSTTRLYQRSDTRYPCRRKSPDIENNIVNPWHRLGLGAKRISTMRMAIITFSGHKVPNPQMVQGYPNPLAPIPQANRRV